MKRTFTLHTFCFIFLAVASPAFMWGCKQNEEKLQQYLSEQNPMDIPDLLPRRGELAKAAEWKKTQEKVTELKQKIASKPEDTKLRLQAATIFIAEQRITGEHHFYYTAIEKILNGVLSLDPKNFEALVYKASLRMSQHQFADAKKLAEEAKNINADNAFVYGILVDANVELGNYDEAIQVSDKMQVLKPSLESYSRASYLREIYGDNEGAIEAMKLAVKAGLEGSEPQSWSRNILGELYFNSGKITEAEAAYAENLATRPSYAPSIAGLAKVAAKKQDYQRAITLLDSAYAIMPQNSFKEQQADVYELMGDTAKATAAYKQVQELLIVDANTPQHSVALELAQSFIKTKQWDSAHKYAMQEYALRPKNIDVNKELAWIAFNKKDVLQSKNYLQVALSTGSKNPELLQRAAAIKNTKL